MIDAVGGCRTAAVPVLDLHQIHTQHFKDSLRGAAIFIGCGMIRTTWEI
jgi:hypothetical protein